MSIISVYSTGIVLCNMDTNGTKYITGTLLLLLKMEHFLFVRFFYTSFDLFESCLSFRHRVAGVGLHF